MRKNRKKLAMVLLVALIAAVAVPVLAAAPGQFSRYNPVVLNSNKDLVPTSPDVSYGYGLSWLLAQPFNGLALAILNLPGFQSIDQLVFGIEKPGYKAPDIGGIFYADEWNRLIMPWYRRFAALASSAALIGIVVTLLGYRIVFSSMNPRQAASIQENIWNLVVATMLVAFGPVIALQLFGLNSALVDFVRAGLGVQGITGLTETLNSSIELIKTGSPLLDALIKLAYAGLALQLNLIYMVRKFVLAVLIIVLPLVGWAWVSKGTRLPMLILLSELATNALMSFSHAVVLALYLTMVRYDGNGMFSTWWAKLFGISLIIPVAALLRRLIAGWLNFLGIDEEKWAGLALAGFGGMLGLANVAGGVVGAFGGMVGRNAEGFMGRSGGGDGGSGGGGPAGRGFTPSMPPVASPRGSEGLSLGMSSAAPDAPGSGPAYAGPGPSSGSGPGKSSRGLDWKSVEDFGGAVGRMAGTVAGVAISGGRMGSDPGAFARVGEMVGRAPVAFARGTARLLSPQKESLDGFRWRDG